MSPSLAFFLGLLLGGLFALSVFELHLLIKMFPLVLRISDGADDEVNSN